MRYAIDRSLAAAALANSAFRTAAAKELDFLVKCGMSL